MENRLPRILLLSLLLTTGCATLPEGSERSDADPWERYNRSVYHFNDAVDRTMLRPVAKGYRAITPNAVEHGIGNFFDNLAYPVVFVNQFLQGDFADGFRDTGRFLVNSTIGIGGIFDPATHIGLEAHNEDFGQTLAVWGIPDGPYFVLPFLGPSTVRDTVGSYTDSYINPMFEHFEEPDRYYLLALRIVDLRAQLLDLDSQLSSTYDPYAFMRNAYLQRRNYLAHDGNVPQQGYDDLYEDFEDFEDFEDEDPAAEENDDTAEDTVPKEEAESETSPEKETGSSS